MKVDINESIALKNFIEAFIFKPNYFIEIHTDKSGKLRVYHADSEYAANDGIAPSHIIDTGVIHGKICWMCII